MSKIPKIPKLTVIYGGQFGSEGKGQVLAAIVRDDRGGKSTPAGRGDYIDFSNRFFAVRVGGPNAGHTVRGASGDILKVQSIPVPAFVFPDCVPAIGAGGLVSQRVLSHELALLRAERAHMPQVVHDPVTIWLDEMAMVVTWEDVAAEHEISLQESIGSTCEGVGAALARKIQRHDVRVARDYHYWPPAVHVVDTVRYLNNTDLPVYVEGTQGYRLGIHTSGFYPFTTSRECGPEGILADVGLTPRSAERVELVCVLRTFPIRVGGNSGDLKNEVTWEHMLEHYSVLIPERTTVTNRVRRIAQWDMGAVVQTIRETRPTCLAITFLDYLFPLMAGVKQPSGLSSAVEQWLDRVQQVTGTPIRYVSTGQGQEFTFQVDI